MTGIYEITEGQLFLDEKEIKLKTPDDARSLGVTAIHQETVLFDELSVAENIFAGNYMLKASGSLDWKGMEQRSAEILKSIDAPIDPKKY